MTPLPTSPLAPAAVSGGWLAFGIVGGVVVGGFLVAIGLWLRNRGTVRAAEREAERILESARAEAEVERQEALVEEREELLEERETLLGEIREARAEVRESERRLEQREASLDERTGALDRREEALEERRRRLAERERTVEAREVEVRERAGALLRELEETAGLSRDEAIERLLERLGSEVEKEQEEVVARIVERARERADRKAREVLTTAIERLATARSSAVATRVVELPTDETKARLVGRQGRNLRLFEHLAGVDLIVDDTPGIVVVSSFDPARREIARIALERLVEDGRIHPARIEEEVARAEGALGDRIAEWGERASLRADVAGLHPKLLTLLGRMRLRTVEGQDALRRAVEIGRLAGLLAGELDLDVALARRCGLLLDVGQAVDDRVDGGHDEIGADLARRYGEPPEVIDAIASHEAGSPPSTVYGVITRAADAVSKARPGARRETLEKYVRRMEELETVAAEYEGVREVHAVQAGREVRVFVEADEVGDRGARKLAREIADGIEEQLAYPGEIEVTLVRETTVVEYAR